VQVEMLKVALAAKLIWASTRELINIFKSNDIGSQVTIVTNSVLKKLSLECYGLD
jgi:transaldolase